MSLPGLFFGAVVGHLLGGAAGTFVGAFLGIVTVGGVGGALLALVADRVGGMARIVYNPTGNSTPYRREHSRARSLAVRGEHERAIEAYRTAILEDPRDPAPYLAIARLLRDEMGRPREAGDWLRRARGDADLDEATRMRVTRELIELYRTKLAEPLRAAPELARLAETWPATVEGRWAAAELAELKRAMRGEGEEGAAPDSRGGPPSDRPSPTHVG